MTRAALRRTWWTVRRGRLDGGVEYLTAHGMKGFWFDIGRAGIVPGIVYVGDRGEMVALAAEHGGEPVEVAMDARGILREVAP